jgi:hypothetical protein
MNQPVNNDDNPIRGPESPQGNFEQRIAELEDRVML